MCIKIPLKFTPNSTQIELGPVTGNSEIVLHKNTTENLLRFLDVLIVPKNGEKIGAKDLVIADRDYIIAILYIDIFGEKIDSTINCKKCNEKFDLDFSLKQILAHYHPKTSLKAQKGIYKINGSTEFRLPTGANELEIEGLSKTHAEKYLMEACVIKGVNNPENVSKIMEEIAPVLNIDMQAICPECHSEQTVKFDLQTFFITKFLQERPILFTEIHAIASNYHWSKNEILSLPRSQRKQFVSLIRNKN